MVSTCPEFLNERFTVNTRSNRTFVRISQATAAAALVAQGLGSDAGIVDLHSTLDYWAQRADQVGFPPPG